MKNTVKVERAIKDITQQELAAAVGVGRFTVSACLSPQAQRSAQQSSRASMLIRFFFMGILLVIDIICGYDVIFCRNVPGILHRG